MSQTITRSRSLSPGSHIHETPKSQNASRTKYTPSKIQRIQHTSVEETYEVLNMHKNAKRSGWWCVINLVLAMLCYFELIQKVIFLLLSWNHALLKYLDFTLVCIFSWNVVANFYNYCLPTFSQKHIPLSSQQKALLGISKENEKFFCTQDAVKPSPILPSKKISTPPSIPLRKSPARNVSTSSVCDYSPGRQSPSQNNLSASRSQYSPGRNTTPLYSPGRFTPKSGKADYSPYTNRQGTPVSNSGSPRLGSSSISPSRVSSLDDEMLDYDSLNKFVKKEEENELRNRRANPETPKGPSFWSYGRSAYEHIPSFGSYQLATRSQSPSVKDDDDTMDSPFKNDEMWKKLILNKKDIDIWTENIRKWLAQTVLEPLVKEIQNINNRLTQMGSPELHIGAISHASLQNLATTKCQQLPSLQSVLPYLSVTTNQEYFIGRLKELSTGGCLRLYRWDSGGAYKGKAWNSDLPSDAQIMNHLFCAYMDTHLPSNPRYSEGKSFTGLHFIKTPAKPSDKKSLLCLYQSRTQKPYFKVLVEDDIWEIPKGRNNLFHAIVVFLHYAKRNYHGMLERVNLGASGINILWVLESR